MTKKAKVQVEKKQVIYLSYRETTEGGGLGEGEHGPYGSRETEYITFQPLAVFIAPGSGGHSIEVDFDPEAMTKDERIFLVIARYTDGDSFGHSEGNWQVMLATKDQDKAQGREVAGKMKQL